MKAIQIGVGGFGSRWIQAGTNVPSVEIVALVDVSKDALQEAGSKGGYDQSMWYETLDEALQAVEADFLICVTPPALHLQYTATAMEHGLHVLCEKPMANNIDECLAMLEVSQRTGRMLAISQNYRYRPATQTLARMVGEKAVGEVGQVKLDFYKGWYFDETSFRRTMVHPTLIDMSIHHFDLIRFITGEEGVTVRGVSWNPTWSDNIGDTSVAMTVEMSGGSHVVYSASWCAQGDFCDWNGNWLIEGDAGSLIYEDEIVTVNHAGSHYKITTTETIEPESLDLSEQEYVLDNFVQCIKEGRQPQTNVADNIRSISMVFAAVEAVDSGNTVRVLLALNSKKN